MAVELNSPARVVVDPPVELAEVDPLFVARPPTEAALAPAARRVKDEAPAKTRSGPNSRLALLTDVNAGRSARRLDGATTACGAARAFVATR